MSRKPDDFSAPIPSLRSRWIGTNIIGKPLTDAKIAQYERAGWYSEEVRRLRKEREAKRNKLRRVGGFIEVEGRLVYSPE